MGLAPGQTVPRVLVAEDVVESRTLLMRLLSMTGFNAREAANGQEAVKITAEWHPHFIWMDIRMPVMDGMTATHLIREQPGGEAVAIAALTASGLLEDREAIMTAGFDEFLRKPFLEQEVFDIMARHLGLIYVYDCENDEKQPYEAKVELSAEMIKNAMTSELRSQLRSAVLALDTDQTMKLVEKIAALDLSTGEALRQLALDLDYDRLLSLVEDAD
jgi:CheY-like chemotaxis protein